MKHRHDDGDVLELIFGTDEYVDASVDGTDEGEVVDPTGGQVWHAFIADDSSPDSDDWQTAGWSTDRTGRAEEYRAGSKPAGITQGVIYAMFAKVAYYTTTPVGFCGYVRWK